MKKLTLLLLLVSLTVQAKFYKATLNYADGTEKSGYTDAPGFSDTTIKFRTSKDGDSEKIESELLSAITITFDDNTKTSYYYIYPAALSMKGAVKKEKKKKWLAAVYLGKTNFLYVTMTGHIADSFPGDYYYINIPGNDYALYFTTKHAGFTKVVGEQKLYKKLIAWHFKDICPALVEKSESGEFVTKDMTELIEFYKKTCE